MSLAAELIDGGEVIRLTSKDISVKMVNVAQKARVYRIDLAMKGARRSCTAHIGWGHAEYEVAADFKADDIARLRAGQLFLNFYGRGPMKRAVVTLKPAAHRHALVWLDSREEQGAALDGLGRLTRTIPASALDYATKKLQRKMKACGVSKTALRTGMKVELEHKDVTRGGIEKTARIALTHLCERKDYYQRLKKYVEK